VDVLGSLGAELLDEALVGVDAELLGAEQQDEALVGVELLGGDAVAVEVPMVAMTRRPMGKIRKLSRTEEMVQVLFVCMDCSFACALFTVCMYTVHSLLFPESCPFCTLVDHVEFDHVF
jgi:hypothetical protein